MSSNRAIVDQLFTHRPLSEEQAAKLTKINDIFHETAAKLVALLPEGDHGLNALHKLREAQLACDNAVVMAPEPPLRSFNMPVDSRP